MDMGHFITNKVENIQDIGMRIKCMEKELYIIQIIK